MEHDVKFSVNRRELTKEAVKFEVKCGGKRLGKLEVRKGCVVWISKHGGKPNTRKFAWEKFDKHMMSVKRKKT